jgi:hypothetical protein
VNNSLKNSGRCLVVDQPADGLQGIAIRNNLVLTENFPDLALVGRDLDLDILAGWQIEHNWRQGPPPLKDHPAGKEWIPATKDRVGEVQVRSLAPGNAHFLRPANDSPLATEGAGKYDLTLPTYVGALPPEGVVAWDWERTWKARK